MFIQELVAQLRSKYETWEFRNRTNLYLIYLGSNKLNMLFKFQIKSLSKLCLHSLSRTQCVWLMCLLPHKSFQIHIVIITDTRAVFLCLPPVGGWSPSEEERSPSLRWRWWSADGTPCPGQSRPDRRSLHVPWCTTGQEGGGRSEEERGKEVRTGWRMEGSGRQKHAQTHKQFGTNENMQHVS